MFRPLTSNSLLFKRNNIKVDPKEAIQAVSSALGHLPNCPCKSCGISSSSSSSILKPSPLSTLHNLNNFNYSFSTSSIDNNNLHETAFEMASSTVRYGPNCTLEVGKDVKTLLTKLDSPVNRVAVVTDSNLLELESSDSPVQKVLSALESENIDYYVFSSVCCEPTADSFKMAIDHLSNNPYDICIAVGGGSVMDTAKAANLYSCYPQDDFLAFVNPPIGRGKVVPGPVKPVICLPSTSGTGSEVTGVSIFDLPDLHAKTGIASRLIKPHLAIVDPLNTLSMPFEVAVASGFDVLCHAIESYTARPYTQRPYPGHPSLRPTYQGSNPIADGWSLSALEISAKNFVPSCESPTQETREQMSLAATLAGFGFGTAGVHIPHGLSYPLSSHAPNEYTHSGYNLGSEFPRSHGFVPHGVSVIISAPAIFTETAHSDLSRHQTVATILRNGRASWSKNPTISAQSVPLESAGAHLADELRFIMERLKIPNGLSALSFGSSDSDTDWKDKIIDSTLPQKRVLDISPIDVGRELLDRILDNSMTLY